MKDKDYSIELQKDCHKFVDLLFESGKVPGATHQDLTNVWIFNKLSQIINRIDKLEDDKARRINEFSKV